MFESSVSHVSHDDFALQIARKHSSGNRLPDSEREEREGSVISAAESLSKKSRLNSIGRHSLQTHRKFYSDERDLRKDLERRAQQAVLGENSSQRKLSLTKYDLQMAREMGSPKAGLQQAAADS